MKLIHFSSPRMYIFFAVMTSLYATLLVVGVSLNLWVARCILFFFCLSIFGMIGQIVWWLTYLTCEDEDLKKKMIPDQSPKQINGSKILGLEGEVIHMQNTGDKDIIVIQIPVENNPLRTYSNISSKLSFPVSSLDNTKYITTVSTEN